MSASTYIPTYADEAAFHADDDRRRTSAEVDYGATWRWSSSNEAHRLAWLRDTGELYVCRADGYDGSCSDVSVVAQLGREAEVDALLEGWQDLRTAPDGLDQVLERVRPLALA